MHESTTVSDFDQMLVFFNCFDKNRDGLIDYEEFERLVTALGRKTTLKQRRVGFSLVDADHDGYIDFSEFGTWWGT